MPQVPTGPLPRSFGTSSKGGKNASRVNLFCENGPLAHKYLPLTPGVGSLTINLCGQVGRYQAVMSERSLSAPSRAAWAPTLP